MTHTKQYEVCKKNFEKKINYSKNYWEKAKFCSRECQVKGRVYLGERGGFKKGIIPWNKGMKGVSCNTGRTHIKKGQHLSPATQFKKGETSWLKGKKNPHFAGANNPRWKGGVTPEHKKIRWSQEYKDFREEIFKRDNYTCQNKDCGRKRKPGDRVVLNAHHIKSFADYPELRLEKSNAITLCKECHEKER
jgi:hypothetical protein